MNKNLEFRRQFLVSRAPIAALADWKFLQLDRFYLYAHPDLEINSEIDRKKSMVLIGCLFDPTDPEKENADILKDIHISINSKNSLFLKLKRYAGRYAILYKDDENTIILHDAFGLREIYYCTNDNQIVCGSQPNILANFGNPEIKPTSNPDIIDFYRNHLKNYSWIGDETYYEGVKHLLPNHYLDIKKLIACRYWPNEPIKQLDLVEAVSKSSSFLQGIMKAIVHRHPVMMAVTSGLDSRTLLAASKEIKDKIYYFINNEKLGFRHPDISVPNDIFKKIQVPFHVHEVPDMMVGEEFKRIFLKNVFLATERILPTIYNVYFKNHSDKVNIVGTGEIGRTRFGKDPRNICSYRMAYKMGYEKCHYAIKQCDQILAEILPIAKRYGIYVLTLFQWEQNKGNRWVVGNSESDIAIEEIDPFDSHLLYEVLLGVNDMYTQYTNPILFRQMIHNMWPELLKWPVNPPYTMRSKSLSLLKKVGLFEPFKEIKYQISYAIYNLKTD